MGLHLGWIPNEPGLRARAYERAAPSEPEPDPARVAALRAAQHARKMWTRLLLATGLLALVLFGALGVVPRLRWAWAVACVLALCCWLPVVLLNLNRRRAAARLATETEQGFTRHAAELAVYEQEKAQWARSEAERVASAPRWLQVAAHEDATRLDVFGGTGPGRQNVATGLGWELLKQRAVIVLDLSQDRVADGLLAAAARAGMSCQDYELPGDLAQTPLLTGLTGEQVASLIVEVVHADDANATAAGRATDLMILRKVVDALGAGDGADDGPADGAAEGADVSMGRLHAALTALLGDPSAPARPPLTAAEHERLGALFGAGFRHQVAGNIVRLAAVVEPLAALGAGAVPRPPARLTCLSLADGPRDVAADLTAALVVQWVTRTISAQGDDDFRPAVILAGADEQSTRHLGRLTAVCERYDIPLVRAFSRLTEESARHLDTRHTAFMRLATRPEALRAAEHIGLERRFVAGRFAHRHSVSRSQTRTTSEAVTHTTGRTEGEAVTHTTGTTTGRSYSESAVPRHEQRFNVQVEEQRGGSGRNDSGRPRGGGRERAGDEDTAGGKDSRGSGGGGSGRGGSGGGSRLTVSQKSGAGRPQTDIIRTSTRFTAKHESEATTTSSSTTEETSHTSGTSRSRTDEVSTGDEITYELVYDHKVAPETLMTLPEDQMLAPHIVEATAGPGKALAPPATDSKMVALVIDPAVIGTELVAAVKPHEIPAFEPPAPQVPDYERVSDRTAIGTGQ